MSHTTRNLLKLARLQLEFYAILDNQIANTQSGNVNYFTTADNARAIVRNLHQQNRLVSRIENTREKE